MRKVKVLIIENGSGLSQLAVKMLSETLICFDNPVKMELFYIKEYSKAIKSDQETFIIAGNYDLVVLIGENNSLELFDVVDNIFCCDTKKIISWFISPEEYLINKVKREFSLSFTDIFLISDGEAASYNAEKTKKSLIANGKVSFQVPYKNLINPTCVFCETYADSTLSEKWANEHGNSIAEELNKNEIAYAAIDGDWNIDISIEQDQLTIVKEIALKSDLSFWQEYFKRHNS